MTTARVFAVVAVTLFFGFYLPFFQRFSSLFISVMAPEFSSLPVRIREEKRSLLLLLLFIDMFL